MAFADTAPARCLVITVADWIAVRSSTQVLARPSYGGRGAAFIFHRLVDDAGDCLLQDICFRAADLLRPVAKRRRLGLEIVSIDEALRPLTDPTTPRFAVLTLDDGYDCNLCDLRITHCAHARGDRAAHGWWEAKLVTAASCRRAFTTRRGNLFPRSRR